MQRDMFRFCMNMCFLMGRSWGRAALHATRWWLSHFFSNHSDWHPHVLVASFYGSDRGQDAIGDPFSRRRVSITANPIAVPHPDTVFREQTIAGERGIYFFSRRNVPMDLIFNSKRASQEPFYSLWWYRDDCMLEFVGWGDVVVWAF